MIHKKINKINKLLAVLALSSTAGISVTFPVNLINDSKIAQDSDVYVFINAKTGGKACVMTFSDPSTGDGNCMVVDATTDLSKHNYALSGFPLDKTVTNAHRINIPKVESGRIYFSIGKPMVFNVNSDQPDALTIPDPDGFKTRDPNYYTLYDKVEFSYTDAGTWINPTAVDFFSVPLSIEQPSSKSTLTKSGFSTSSRQDIFNHVKNVFGEAKNTSPATFDQWQNLFLNYDGQFSDGTQGTVVLRLIAPGKAMQDKNPLSQNTPFDRNYLNNTALGYRYIDGVWDYYKNATVKIDATELKGNPNAQQLSDYIFTGTVNASDQFVFKNSTGDSTVAINKPESISFFAGAQGSFDAPNNTPKAIIIRSITSAFEVGLLPAPDGTLMNKDYFVEHKPSYYMVNSLLGATGTNTGPWYDLYSKGLHSVSEKEPIYTFAYDDALDQDGTLHDPNGDNIGLTTITIGNMEGVKIPDPTNDSATYNLYVTLGQNQQNGYYPLVVKGQTIEPGAAVLFQNVKAPLSVQFNNKTYEIDIKHPMVRPYDSVTDGIVITTTYNDETKTSGTANVVFPGPPSQ